MLHEADNLSLIILLFSLVGLLLLSRKQSLATDRVHRRSCRRLPRNKRIPMKELRKRINISSWEQTLI